MRTHFLTTIVALVLAWTTALAGNYELFPPKQAVESRLAEFHVYTTDDLTLQLPPAHRDFIWLDTKLEDQETKDAEGVARRIHHGVFRCIPLRTGTLEAPPLPATVAGSKVLLRFEPLVVATNPLPADATRMVTLWNGATTPPTTAVAGESIDLEILLFGAREKTKAVTFGDPELMIPNARWQSVSTNLIVGGNIKITPFHMFDRYNNYSQTSTRENDVDFTVRRYKTRFSVGESGTLEGVLAARVGVGGQSRHVIQHVSIPIRPLPPAPRGEFFNTGLVGLWSFKATMDPPQPVAGRPFTLRIDIDGIGERYQCKDFDFSGPGFKSMDKSLTDSEDSRFDHWRAHFEQRLLATGQTASFPGVVLGSFDPAQDKWVKHAVLAAQPVTGATAQSDLPDLTITPSTGESIRRPIWLNFPPALMLLAAFAPFLPFAGGLLRKRLDARDPKRAALRRQRAALTRQLEKANATETATLLEQEGMPLLRAHLGLPDAAAPGEIATALARDSAGQELAALLREHNASRFSGGASVLDGRKLAKLFGQLALLFLICAMHPLHAMTAEECDAAARKGDWESAAKGYEALIQEDNGRPAIHLNLAKVLTSAGRLQEARAACQTTLLLDPGNRSARNLQSSLLHQLNEPPVFSIWLWRPDQILAAATGLWAFAWLALALHRLRWLPVRWPAFAIMGLAVCLAGAGELRAMAYVAGQYLVISNEDPSLPAGKIVRGTPADDAAFVTTSLPDGGTRVIPAKQLRAIW
jgi:hypothetical protein